MTDLRAIESLHALHFMYTHPERVHLLTCFQKAIAILSAGSEGILMKSKRNGRYNPAAALPGAQLSKRNGVSMVSKE
jgi:hypothetical protein